MVLDKSHPKYPEYAKEFQELVRCGREEAGAVQICDGLDGPLVAVHRKYAGEMKKLQEKYSYLFTEEVSDDQNHP